MQSLHPTRPAGLLGVPWSNRPKSEIDLAILLVSRQVSEEALDVLYGENAFRATLRRGDRDVFSKLAPTNRQRIRRLPIVLQDTFDHTAPPYFDSQIWPQIFANLTKLCIVAEQPLEPSKQKMDEWLTWLKHVLQCVNQYVSSGSVVEVDDDDREETSSLVKECLRNGYRKATSTS
ncbi:MAG: hypothetical protein M1813_007836 [Trichoglossum hirsutum]|nr:MAG: hypothetical protein M1813_007836 [Trichoglossum hirsutum]